LKQINEEEARVLRLYASGLVTEENWRNLWAEWQDKRQKLRASLDLLDQKCETYINDLDDALTLITKLGILYEKLPRSDQKELLRNVVERVVVNPEGRIERVDLLPPFAYLQDVSEKVSGCGGTSENAALKQTSDPVVACSRQVFDWGHLVDHPAYQTNNRPARTNFRLSTELQLLAPGSCSKRKSGVTPLDHTFHTYRAGNLTCTTSTPPRK
jgi:hypothetical protein